MGTDVSVQQVLDKFDVQFGDVCPTDMTLEQFFTARQLPTESMSAWGCRQEDIVSKIKDPASAAAAQNMLRTRYWTGIYYEKTHNALPHHFDEGADFEFLKHAHQVVQARLRGIREASQKWYAKKVRGATLQPGDQVMLRQIGL